MRKTDDLAMMQNPTSWLVLNILPVKNYSKADKPGGMPLMGILQHTEQGKFILWPRLGMYGPMKGFNQDDHIFIDDFKGQVIDEGWIVD